MEKQVTSMIEYMTKSHQQMANIINSKRHITGMTSQVVHAMPDQQLTFQDMFEVSENAMKITKNIAAYLNSLADLEEALSENLSIVIGELSPGQEEQE